MNKAGLLAALAGAIGLAYVAYPKADRTPGVFAKIGGAVAERDASQPTALEKLKSATKVSTWPQEPQAALPPPRVVDHVKQEIQARPVAGSETAAPAVTAPVPASVAIATTTSGAATQRPAGTAGQAGIDRLNAKLPDTAPVTAPGSGQSAPVNAATSPAVTVPSTIILPRFTAAGAETMAAQPPKGEEVATAPTAAAAPEAAGQSAAARTRKSTAERRRPASREANGVTVQRLPRVSTVFGRNDGL